MSPKPILHMSDLHFGKNDATTLGAIAAIETVIERWGATSEKPVVVMTGDIVNDGEEAQYAIARVHIQRLRAAGFEVFPILGNHDYGEEGSHADADRFALFKNAFYPDRPLSYPDPIRMDGWIILLLDSMRAELGPIDRFLADGELGEEQILALQTLLDQTEADRRAGAKVVVCLHHHPFIFPDASVIERFGEWATHWLKDGSKFMTAISGRADVLLFGHDHRAWNFTNELGGKVLTTDYQIPVILSCGTSSGVNDIAGHSGRREAFLIENANGTLTVQAVEL